MKAEPVATRAAGPAGLLIVDDHEITRSGLCRMLASEPDLAVIGEAGSGRESVELSCQLRPNLVLMDIRMPDVDGITVTRAIKQQCPQTSVIMVTIYENPDYLNQALKVGAAGYLLKDATKQQVVQAVRQVLQGESLLPPELATQLLQRLMIERSQRSQEQLVEPLTVREAEVLRLLAEGLTNPEIAYHLQLSLATVKVHVGHIIAKLGVSDRTQAAVRAIHLGLLPDVGNDAGALR
jgi:DNA-binding NarL/FixJ family response regulator